MHHQKKSLHVEARTSRLTTLNRLHRTCLKTDKIKCQSISKDPAGAKTEVWAKFRWGKWLFWAERIAKQEPQTIINHPSFSDERFRHWPMLFGARLAHQVTGPRNLLYSPNWDWKRIPKPHPFNQDLPLTIQSLSTTPRSPLRLGVRICDIEAGTGSTGFMADSPAILSEMLQALLAHMDFG